MQQQQQSVVNDNTAITLTLPLGAVNVVLNALGSRPFSEVAPLIQAVQAQATQQIKNMEDAAKAASPSGAASNDGSAASETGSQAA